MLFCFHLIGSTGPDSAYVDGVNKYFTHGREGQWLGGTIALPNADGEAIVVRRILVLTTIFL